MEQTNSIEIKVENNFKGVPNYLTMCILDCMKFWNRNESFYEKNKSGEFGSKFTKELANRVPADDFLLEMMLIDCQTYVNSNFSKDSKDTYECGRTRSHVWVHMNGERIFMFYI